MGFVSLFWRSWLRVRVRVRGLVWEECGEGGEVGEEVGGEEG